MYFLFHITTIYFFNKYSWRTKVKTGKRKKKKDNNIINNYLLVYKKSKQLIFLKIYAHSPFCKNTNHLKTSNSQSVFFFIQSEFSLFSYTLFSYPGSNPGGVKNFLTHVWRCLSLVGWAENIPARTEQHTAIRPKIQKINLFSLYALFVFV
jgi:hypothetical protein